MSQSSPYRAHHRADRAVGRRLRRTGALVLTIAAVTTPLSVSAARADGFEGSSDNGTVTFLSDSMDRTVHDGWGGVWSFTDAGDSGVHGSSATLELPSGVARLATVTGASVRDSATLVRLSLEALPTSGNGTWFAVSTRLVGGFSYQQRVQVSPGGEVRLTTVRVDGSSDRLVRLADQVLPFTVSAGEALYLRTQVQGSDDVTLASRLFEASGPEPSWQIVAHDRSPQRLAATGAFGVWGYTSSSSPANAVQVDGIRADDLAPAVTPTPTDTGGKPGPGNTGVPAGTTLTRHDGDLTITKPGTVIDGLDIHGFVTIKAANVTIRRSIVRGGVARRQSNLVTTTSPGVLITDSELAPEHPSVDIDGLKGYGFTARRLDVHDVVDSVLIWGDDTTVESSWLHDNLHLASDPQQGGGPSHDDNVQVQGGDDIRIAGNTTTGAYNSALQVTQDMARISDLSYIGNWADGGGCTVNIAEKRFGAIRGLTVSSNRFGTDTRVADCAIIMPRATGASAATKDNVWDASGLPVRIRVNG